MSSRSIVRRAGLHGSRGELRRHEGGPQGREEGGELTHEEARDAAAVLRAEFDTALQTILTPEQYEALLALRPDCEGPRPPGRP